MQRAYEQADVEVFKGVRDLFGGRVRQAVSGAAPIAPSILEFLCVRGVPVLEVWGMTETTAVGTVSTRWTSLKFGTVGRAMPGVEITYLPRLTARSWCAGPTCFREYWENPEVTAETFVDDWLRTGDLGELDDEGYLTISGRKKDIIITAGGKNLTPANLENDLKQSRFISQAVMHGDRRPFPVALITLDEEEIQAWARDRDKAAGHPGASHATMTFGRWYRRRSIVQTPSTPQVAQVKRFTILDHDLSPEAGELTPTLKVKRAVINERYADVFDDLYR